jgi:2-polyprenyl-3-methyl-5-hydroxy-6-metoxy-1,4-benzoquinol methylase
MKSLGWEGTAIDPDPRAVAHARDCVKVHAWCGDFSAAPELGRFDAVTLNKVLEHVADPAAMLRRTHDYVRAGGFVYVEVPDGECAATQGPGREEFFIEHHHVFSLASLAMLAAQTRFVVRAIERLQEPSTKYTLRAFLVPAYDGPPSPSPDSEVPRWRRKA